MITATVEGADGVQLKIAEWPGGDLGSALAIHATGFCKEVWSPIAAALSELGVRVVAIDQRGHGGSGPPPSPDWWALGADTAKVASELGPFDVGLGHSSGATAVAMAALGGPGLFARLVLVEPVVFPPGTGYDDTLAARARQRRSSFASMADARAHFEGRGIFAGWDPVAFEGYLQGGLRPAGATFELSCSPQLEAGFYELGSRHGLWDRLDDLTTPVSLLIGERSVYHSGAFADELAARFDAELTVVPGADHFLPMQAPEAVVTAVLAAFAD